MSGKQGSVESSHMMFCTWHDTSLSCFSHCHSYHIAHIDYSISLTACLEQATFQL